MCVYIKPCAAESVYRNPRLVLFDLSTRRVLNTESFERSFKNLVDLCSLRFVCLEALHNFCRLIIAMVVLKEKYMKTRLFLTPLMAVLAPLAYTNFFLWITSACGGNLVTRRHGKLLVIIN